MSFSKVALAIGVATALASSAHAASVLDQNSPPLGGRLNQSMEWQQQVTAGLAGQLAGITLYGDNTDVLLRIGQAAGFYSGPFTFSQTVHLTNAGTFIDTSAANIQLAIGQAFVIDLSQGSVGNILAAASPYGGGHLFLNDGGVTDMTAFYGISLAFQTYVGTSSGVVPEPAAWMLMIAGFGMIGATLRRRDRYLA